MLQVTSPSSRNPDTRTELSFLNHSDLGGTLSCSKGGIKIMQTNKPNLITTVTRAKTAVKC